MPALVLALWPAINSESVPRTGWVGMEAQPPKQVTEEDANLHTVTPATILHELFEQNLRVERYLVILRVMEREILVRNCRDLVGVQHAQQIQVSSRVCIETVLRRK